MRDCRECDGAGCESCDDTGQECEQPCRPDDACPACERYWAEMRAKGYWNDRTGWTWEALRHA